VERIYWRGRRLAVLAAYALAGDLDARCCSRRRETMRCFLFSYLLAIDVATVALVRLRRGRSCCWGRFR